LTWSISCIWLELRAEIQPKLVKLKVSPNPKSKLNENSSRLSKNDLRPTPRHRGNPDNVELNAMPQKGGRRHFPVTPIDRMLALPLVRPQAQCQLSKTQRMVGYGKLSFIIFQ